MNAEKIQCTIFSEFTIKEGTIMNTSEKIKRINKRIHEIDSIINKDGRTDATSHPLWNECERLLYLLYKLNRTE